MTTLAEIESAFEGLSADEQRVLLMSLATRLRTSGVPLPPPRQFTIEEINGWVAEDEADARRLGLSP